MTSTLLQQESSSIVELFDQLCFSFGDEDAIRVVVSSPEPADDNDDNDGTIFHYRYDSPSPSLGYSELQEYSKALARQLVWRYRPHTVLVDCHGWPGAETVAILACLRLQIPWVPVSCHQQHAGTGRLGRIVQQLVVVQQQEQQQQHAQPQRAHEPASIVAVTCCRNDQDPVLGVFQKANVHSILFLDPDGNLQEPLDVPSKIPDNHNNHDNDNLYVLFTSGTSSPHPKAVLGSHQATLQRLRWFQETFEALPIVAKRTPLTFVDAVAELLGTLLTRDSVLVAVAPPSVSSSQRGQQQVAVVDIGTLVATTECAQISMLPSQLAQLLQYNQSQCLATQRATDDDDNNNNNSSDSNHRRVHDTLRSLRRIIISGEPCSPALWNSFHQTFYDADQLQYSCQLINLYGQTETTGDVCAAVLTELAAQNDHVIVNGAVTIGKPLRDSITIHAPPVDDKNNHTSGSDGEKDLGIIGHELVVSGHDCFSNGYLGQTSKETEKGGFVFDSSQTNATSVTPKITSFATGDFGFCKDGLWYVQGRTDDVTKVNGIVTAPSEVESAFETYFRQQPFARNNGACTAAAAVMVDHRICLLLESNVDEATFCFSRQHMKEQTDLPWNLIPHQVCLTRQMPRTAGTGKVDRSRVKNILQSRTQNFSTSAGDKHKNKNHRGSTCDASMDLFQRIVASVLMPEDTEAEHCAIDQLHPAFDLSKSFVDVGFDSALSISLLYQLKLHWRPPPNLGRDEEEPTKSNPLDFLNANDILNAERMRDFFDALVQPKNSLEKRSSRQEGKKQPKLRHKYEFREVFTSAPVTVWDPTHCSVSFAACVDVTPVVSCLLTGRTDGCYVFAGCQNGVVQRMRYSIGGNLPPEEEVRVTACHHLNGWRVSSDMLLARDSIIVCAVRHPVQDPSAVPGSKIMAMSLDLASIEWVHEFPTACTAKLPACCHNDIWVVEVNENNENHNIRILNARDGQDTDCYIKLPVSITAMPVLLTDCHFKRLDGTIVSEIMVYGSSDFETGLVLIDVERRVQIHDFGVSSDSQLVFSDCVGPIHKGLVAWDSHSVLAADSWGSLHCLNLRTRESKSIKLANKALSSPAVTKGPIRRILVGAYDGTVHCIDASLSTTLWTINVKSVVYAKPLLLSDEKSVVVCTTAGDVLQIDLSKGNVIWHYRMPIGAEVWSSPVERPKVCVDAQDLNHHPDQGPSICIAFGARDSRMHFVKLGKG